MVTILSDESIAGVWGTISWKPWRILTGDLNSHLPNLASRKSDPLIHFWLQGGRGRGVVSL